MSSGVTYTKISKNQLDITFPVGGGASPYLFTRDVPYMFAGEEYTIRFEVIKLNTPNTTVDLGYSFRDLTKTGFGNRTVTVDNDGVIIIEANGTMIGDAATSRIIFYISPPSTPIMFRVGNVAVNKGNIKYPWSPAPEDLTNGASEGYFIATKSSNEFNFNDFALYNLKEEYKWLY